jgi:hypothetical protein
VHGTGYGMEYGTVHSTVRYAVFYLSGSCLPYLSIRGRKAPLSVIVRVEHLQLERCRPVVRPRDGMLADGVLRAHMVQRDPLVYVLVRHRHLVPPILRLRDGRPLEPARTGLVIIIKFKYSQTRVWHIRPPAWIRKFLVIRLAIIVNYTHSPLLSYVLPVHKF